MAQDLPKKGKSIVSTALWSLEAEVYSGRTDSLGALALDVFSRRGRRVY